MQQERRHFHRYTWEEGKAVRATTPSQSLGRVQDLSHRGLTVQLDSRSRAPTRLALSYDRERVHTPLGRVLEVCRRDLRAGMELVTPDVSLLGQVSRILDRVHRARATNPGQDERRWEPIEDRAHLMMLCRSLSANQVTASVYGELGRHQGEARLRRARARRDRLVMSWDWSAPTPAGVPRQLHIQGHNAMYRLYVEETEALDSGQLRTFGPSRVERLRRRRFPRISPALPITVQFEHPLIPGRVVRKELADITFDGLGFEVDLLEDLLFHDLEIPALRLELPEEISLRARGKICHNFELRRQGRLYCGLHILDMPSTHRHRWCGLVQRHLTPSVDRADSDALDRIWDHYTRAKYFSLSGKTPELFARQERQFCDVWGRINEARGLGELSVWRRGEELAGSLTTVRAYHRTLLIQGLATRIVDGAPGKGTISRELYYSIFHQGIVDPSVHFMLAYLCLGSARRWHEVLCEDFARRHPDRAAAHRFFLMEGGVEEGAGPEPGGPVDLALEPPLEVGPARRSELAWLTRHALHPVLRQALDYTDQGLKLEQVNRRLAVTGLRRQRRILAARCGGELLGLAVVEAGGEGINPYNLLDCLRVFCPLGEADPRSRPAARALLAAARREFFRLGCKKFILFADDALRPCAEEVGLRSIDEGICWVLHRDGFPAYLSHIYEIIAPD